MSGPARRTLVLGPAEAGPFILAPQVPMTVGAAPGRRGNPPGGLAFPLGVGGHWGERRPYYKARGRRLRPPFSPSPPLPPRISNSDDEIAAYLGPRAGEPLGDPMQLSVHVATVLDRGRRLDYATTIDKMRRAPDFIVSAVSLR